MINIAVIRGFIKRYMTVENVLPSAIKMNFIMLVELSKLLVNIRKR